MVANLSTLGKSAIKVVTDNGIIVTLTIPLESVNLDLTLSVNISFKPRMEIILERMIRNHFR